MAPFHDLMYRVPLRC